MNEPWNCEEPKAASSSPAFLGLYLIILKILEVQGDVRKQEYTKQHLKFEKWQP